MHGRFSLRRYMEIEGEAFDMTPVIDVVFLLIIFFMLVCQFITVERFRVQVPEQIASAVPPQTDDQTLTLTVLPLETGAMGYAVADERLRADDRRDLPSLIAAAIDEYYRTAPTAQCRIVRLRCDKSAVFGDVRPVLEGIAQSSATDVDWAVRGE